MTRETTKEVEREANKSHKEELFTFQQCKGCQSDLISVLQLVHT